MYIMLVKSLNVNYFMFYILDLWQFEQLYTKEYTKRYFFFRWTCDYVAHQCFKNIKKHYPVSLFMITLQLEFVKNSSIFFNHDCF